MESPGEEDARDERHDDHHDVDSEDDPPAIQRFMKHINGNSLKKSIQPNNEIQPGTRKSAKKEMEGENRLLPSQLLKTLRRSKSNILASFDSFYFLVFFLFL